MKTLKLGVHIRDQLAFQLADFVFQYQLALFHAAQPELVAEGIGRHLVNGFIQVTMFFPEPDEQLTDLHRLQ